MAQQANLQKTFLRFFISSLIEETRKKIPKEELVAVQQALAQEEVQRNIPPPKQITQPTPKRIIHLPERNVQITEMSSSPQVGRPIPRIPMVKPREGFLDLGKLNFLIADHWVSSIECPGPNKRVTVKKGNKILTTSAVLNEEEINKIIDEFSIATKIPIAHGTLKALHQNLMITAIVSDLIGGRFVIQKINPQTITT